MRKIINAIGIIGMFAFLVWFMTLIFIDLPDWTGIIPLGMMMVSIGYSDCKEKIEEL